jgi:hypothetical protein
VRARTDSSVPWFAFKFRLNGPATLLLAGFLSTLVPRPRTSATSVDRQAPPFGLMARVGRQATGGARSVVIFLIVSELLVGHYGSGQTMIPTFLFLFVATLYKCLLFPCIWRNKMQCHHEMPMPTTIVLKSRRRAETVEEVAVEHGFTGSITCTVRDLRWAEKDGLKTGTAQIRVSALDRDEARAVMSIKGRVSGPVSSSGTTDTYYSD